MLKRKLVEIKPLCLKLVTFFVFGCSEPSVGLVSVQRFAEDSQLYTRSNVTPIYGVLMFENDRFYIADSQNSEIRLGIRPPGLLR